MLDQPVACPRGFGRDDPLGIVTHPDRFGILIGHT